MPKQRPVIESGLKAPEVKTSFPRFADGYIPGAAARGASSQLEQLARGLEGFNRNVGGLMTELRQKQIAEREREGQTIAKTGEELPEDASRHLRIGFASAKGDMAAHDAYEKSLAEVAARRDNDEVVSPEDWHEIYQANLAEANAANANFLEDKDYMDANADTASALERGEAQNVARAFTEGLQDNTRALQSRDLNAGFRNGMTMVPEGETELLTPAEVVGELNAEVDYLIKEKGVRPQSAVKMGWEAAVAQIAGNDQIPLARRVEMVEALKKFDFNGVNAEDIPQRLMELNALENQILDTNDKKKKDARDAEALKTRDAQVAALGTLLDLNDGRVPTTDELNAVYDTARANGGDGGAEAEDYARRYQQGQEERRNKDLNESDEVAVKELYNAMYVDRLPREKVLELYRENAAAGKFNATDTRMIGDRIEAMPQSGFTNNLQGDHRRRLRVRYTGGDLMPGQDPRNDQQLLHAEAEYEAYLEENGYQEVVRANDEIAMRKLEREAFEHATFAVPTLLTQVGQDVFTEVTEETVHQMRMVPNEVIAPILAKVAEIKSNDGSIAELPKDMKDTLQEYDFYVGGNRNIIATAQYLNYQLTHPERQ